MVSAQSREGMDLGFITIHHKDAIVFLPAIILLFGFIFIFRAAASSVFYLVALGENSP